MTADADTTPEKPPHVFLSHARADRDVVDRLVKILSRRGIPIWADIDAGLGEEEAVSMLAQAIDEAALFVVLLTPQSIQRPWVKWEVAHALRGSVPLLPVMHQITSADLDSDPFLSLAKHELISFEALERDETRLWSSWAMPGRPKTEPGIS